MAKCVSDIIEAKIRVPSPFILHQLYFNLCNVAIFMNLFNLFLFFQSGRLCK
jgi:hypothetical protein